MWEGVSGREGMVGSEEGRKREENKQVKAERRGEGRKEVERERVEREGGRKGKKD